MVYICIITGGDKDPHKTMKNGKSIFLQDGRLLKQLFGKYQPGLQMIVPAEGANWEVEMNYLFGIPLGGKRVDILSGRYFVSKKGAPTFEADLLGPHLLVKEQFGSGYLRPLIPTDGAMHFRRAGSNAGATGYNWLVFPKGHTNNIGVDDI